MNLLARCRHRKAFRYLAYAVAFALWLGATLIDMVTAARREWRVNWATFVLTIEGVEAHWTRKGKA